MEWELIETAPKGQLILGLSSGMVRLVTYEEGEWLTVGADFARYWFEPTHWMPLPAIPAEPTDAEGGK